MKWRIHWRHLKKQNPQQGSQGWGSISLMSLGMAPFDRHKTSTPPLMFEILSHFPNKSDDVTCAFVLRRPPSKQTSFLSSRWAHGGTALGHSSGWEIVQHRCVSAGGGRDVDKVGAWGGGQKQQMLKVHRIPKDNLDLRVKQGITPLSVRMENVTTASWTPLSVRMDSVTTASRTYWAWGCTVWLQLERMPASLLSTVEMSITKGKQIKPPTQNNSTHHVSKQYWLPLSSVFKVLWPRTDLSSWGWKLIQF